MRGLLTIAALGLLALLVGCGSPAAGGKGQGARETRRIKLTHGTAISTEAGVDGATRVVVIVDEGLPGAGTYSSTSPYIVETATSVMERLGEPGVAVTIEVDDAGEILSITDSVTMLR